MRKINRKRLNNKGFTLIELLAVVIILAIVMGLAANGILNSINNSRKSSLVSAAKNAANTLNTWSTDDEVAMDVSTRHFDTKFVETLTTANGAYVQLDNTDLVVNGKQLMKTLNLSAADFIIECAAIQGGGKETVPKCSGIKYDTVNGFQIVLVAKDGGKYYVKNALDSTYNTMYASSMETSINVMPS